MKTTKEIIEIGKNVATDSQRIQIEKECNRIATKYSTVKSVIENRLLFNIGATHLSQLRSFTSDVPVTLGVYLGITSDEAPIDFLTLLPENYYER